MTELETIYRKALERICRCDERDLSRYCLKVDGIALDAIIEGDLLLSDDVNQAVIEDDVIPSPTRRAA